MIFEKKILALSVLSLLLLSACKDSALTTQVGDLNLIPFPCEDGKAAGVYDCENVGLYASVSASELGGVRLNDIWGWTDPQSGKEYALVGLTDGVSFVDISDPAEPIVIGKLAESNISAKYKILQDPNYEACLIGIGDTEASKSLEEGSSWRDMKVYDNHMFVVSDAQPHGMQVFDLTRLRSFSGSFMNFTEDALYDSLANAHNVVINEQTGFAYVVGSTNGEVCNEGGLHMIDIRNPKNPTFAGCYNNTVAPRRRVNSAYIHDSQCVIYSGPDSRYTGKEICFNAAERSVDIADVSDKENPVQIGFEFEPLMYYSHQGWLTEDQAYFIMNDELDELNLGRNTKTYVFDVRNLENPEFVGYYDHTTFSIDHNLYVKNGLVYQANYTTGLRILEINNIANANLSQVAYFKTDTLQRNRENVFEGSWSNYPYFESGNIIVSDINNGLYILSASID